MLLTQSHTEKIDGDYYIPKKYEEYDKLVLKKMLYRVNEHPEYFPSEHVFDYKKYTYDLITKYAIDKHNYCYIKNIVYINRIGDTIYITSLADGDNPLKKYYELTLDRENKTISNIKRIGYDGEEDEINLFDQAEYQLNYINIAFRDEKFDILSFGKTSDFFMGKCVEYIDLTNSSI